MTYMLTAAPWHTCPSSTTTWPLQMTNSGTPCTSMPSKMLKSTAWWCVLAEMVLVAFGSQITMSASEPTAIRPWQYKRQVLMAFSVSYFFICYVVLQPYSHKKAWKLHVCWRIFQQSRLLNWIPFVGRCWTVLLHLCWLLLQTCTHPSCPSAKTMLQSIITKL